MREFNQLCNEVEKIDVLTIVCLLICAIDGTISYKERKWVKQLIK